MSTPMTSAHFMLREGQRTSPYNPRDTIQLRKTNCTSSKRGYRTTSAYNFMTKVEQNKTCIRTPQVTITTK